MTKSNTSFNQGRDAAKAHRQIDQARKAREASEIKSAFLLATGKMEAAADELHREDLAFDRQLESEHQFHQEDAEINIGAEEFELAFDGRDLA